MFPLGSRGGVKVTFTRVTSSARDTCLGGSLGSARQVDRERRNEEKVRERHGLFLTFLLGPNDCGLTGLAVPGGVLQGSSEGGDGHS